MGKLKSIGQDFSSNKRFNICLAIAIFLHLLLLFYFYAEQKIQEIRKNRLLAIEYKEEEKKKEEQKKEPEKPKEKEPPKQPTPQTAVITPKDLFKIQQLKDKIDENMLKKLENIARPMDNQLTNMKIDLDKMILDHSDQVKLDADQFDADIGLDAPTVRLGPGVSMDQILAQDQVQMPMAAAALPAAVGLIARPGFSGTDNGHGGIEISNGPAEKLEDNTRKTLIQNDKNKDKNTQIQTKNSSPVQIEISGELADRERIAGPNPPYPDWAQKQGLAAVLSIQLKVNADGVITGTPIVISPTGYPDWDNGVIKWLRDNWRWKKIPSGETPGVITIRFTIG